MTPSEIQKINDLYKELDRKTGEILILEQTIKTLQAQLETLSLAVSVSEVLNKLKRLHKEQ
jgi:hypothetical protein